MLERSYHGGIGSLLAWMELQYHTQHDHIIEVIYRSPNNHGQGLHMTELAVLHTVNQAGKGSATFSVWFPKSL